MWLAFLRFKAVNNIIIINLQAKFQNVCKKLGCGSFVLSADAAASYAHCAWPCAHAYLILLDLLTVGDDRTPLSRARIVFLGARIVFHRVCTEFRLAIRGTIRHLSLELSRTISFCTRSQNHWKNYATLIILIRRIQLFNSFYDQSCTNCFKCIF